MSDPKSKLEVALSAGTLAAMSILTILLCLALAVSIISVHFVASPKAVSQPVPQYFPGIRPGNVEQAGSIGSIGTTESKEAMEAKHGPINHGALHETKEGWFRNRRARQCSEVNQCGYVQYAQPVRQAQSAYCYQQSTSYSRGCPIVSRDPNCVPCNQPQIRPVYPNNPPVQPNANPNRIEPSVPYIPDLPEIQNHCKDGKCSL